MIPGKLQFDPQHSLQFTKIQKALLVGFRRLGRHPPGVLLPIFLDASDRGVERFLYQRVGPGSTILALVADPDLKRDNLVHADIARREIFVTSGEALIFAYELNGSEYLVARDREFRERLGQILEEGRLASSPFAGLEVARFLENAGEERKFAVRCAAALAQRSPRVAKLWCAGAILSFAARRAANNATHAAIYGRMTESDRILQSPESSSFGSSNDLGRIRERAHDEDTQRSEDKSDRNWQKAEALRLRKSGLYAEALALYDILRANYPDDVKILTLRVNCLREMNQLSEALAECDALCERFSNVYKVWAVRSSTLRQQGSLDSALTESAGVIERFPNKSDAYLHRVSLLREMGAYDEALSECLMAKRLFPDDTKVAIRHVSLLRQLGRTEEAADVVDVLLRRFPSVAKIWALKVGLLLAMGQDHLLLETLSAIPLEAGRAAIFLKFASAIPFADLNSAIDAIQKFPKLGTRVAALAVVATRLSTDLADRALTIALEIPDLGNSSLEDNGGDFVRKSFSLRQSLRQTLPRVARAGPGMRLIDRLIPRMSPALAAEVRAIIKPASPGSVGPLL